MKDVVIFEDGKGARGSKAKLVRRGNKRVLIEFVKYDDNMSKDIIVTEWFNLFIPRWSRDKKQHKHNNSRKHAVYYHSETNEFYSDECQTEAYRLEVKDYFTAEYYDELFGSKITLDM